jgi:hypothetical protein
VIDLYPEKQNTNGYAAPRGRRTACADSCPPRASGIASGSHRRGTTGCNGPRFFSPFRPVFPELSPGSPAAAGVLSRRRAIHNALRRARGTSTRPRSSAGKVNSMRPVGVGRKKLDPCRQRDRRAEVAAILTVVESCRRLCLRWICRASTAPGRGDSSVGITGNSGVSGSVVAAWSYISR